jgi:hypothetical protein
MSIILSIANGSLYEACRLRANRWSKIRWNKDGMEQWGKQILAVQTGSFPAPYRSSG